MPRRLPIHSTTNESRRMNKPTTESFRVRNERAAAIRAAQLIGTAALRGVTPSDLFISIAAVVANRNPNLGRKVLDSIEATIRQRPLLPPAGTVIVGGPVANTETAPAGLAAVDFGGVDLPPTGDECQCKACQAEQVAA